MVIAVSSFITVYSPSYTSWHPGHILYNSVKTCGEFIRSGESWDCARAPFLHTTLTGCDTTNTSCLFGDMSSDSSIIPGSVLWAPHCHQTRKSVPFAELRICEQTSTILSHEVSAIRPCASWEMAQFYIYPLVFSSQRRQQSIILFIS